MTILLTICAFCLGALFGGRLVRNAYESYIDDIFDEMNQSEEDFLGYAAPDDAALRDTRRRINKEKHER